MALLYEDEDFPKLEKFLKQLETSTHENTTAKKMVCDPCSFPP
jgi:hypothetical protein